MRNIDACRYVRPSDRTTLERLVADGKTPQKIVARARIVLLSGCGFGTNSIQREARVSKPTVWRWQKAYMDGGVERLLKDRGKGARAGKKPIRAEVRLAIVKRTAQEKPKHATHWSARMLAEEIGVGHTTVQRVWKEHGLKPHLTRPFKLSNDPKFAEKVVDIVGLYLNPPDKAVVLCVDEKSQIQALDRTQPGLPMKKGRAQTMTHDYKRNGTTTLFAALDVKTGEVIGECLPRHRAKELIRFLKKINRAVAKHLDVHAICDDYKTHKTKEVQAWTRQACALQAALHTNIVVLDQPGRAAVRRNHPPANPPRRIQERRRTRGCHRDLAHRAQRQTEALQVDRQSQYHPREECTCQARAGRRPRGGY